MALRTRCTSGSTIFSITPLSSSVPSPEVLRLTFLPSREAMSRTIRGKRLKAKSTGSMRTDITASCRSRVLRSSCPRPASSCSCRPGSSSAERCASMAWVMTSSPTRLISASTLSTATRMVVSPASWRPPPAAAGGAAAAAGAGATGASGAGSAAATADAAGAGAEAPSASGSMLRVHWSSTHANVSSMAERLTLPISCRSQASQASNGSSSLNGGSASSRQATFSSPSWPSSRSMRSGSLPLRNSERSGSKLIDQPCGSALAGLAAVGAAWVAGASLAPDSRRSSSARARASMAWSMASPCSAAASSIRSASTEPSSALMATPSSVRLPLRASSSRVSSRWVRSAIAVKPKVALPPLIECAARNTTWMVSPPPPPDSMSSSPASMAARFSRLSSKKVAWKRVMSMDAPRWLSREPCERWRAAARDRTA